MTPAFRDVIVESHLWHLQLFFLTAAALNFMLTALALSLCIALKFHPLWVGVVFALTTPLWAHAALALFRWRQRRS